MVIASLIKVLKPGLTIEPISSDDPASGHLAAFVIREDGTDDIEGIKDMINYLLSSDPNRWVAVYKPSVMDKFSTSKLNKNIAYGHDVVSPADYSVMSVEEFTTLLK